MANVCPLYCCLLWVVESLYSTACCCFSPFGESSDCWPDCMSAFFVSPFFSASHFLSFSLSSGLGCTVTGLKGGGWWGLSGFNHDEIGRQTQPLTACFHMFSPVNWKGKQTVFLSRSQMFFVFFISFDTFWRTFCPPWQQLNPRGQINTVVSCRVKSVMMWMVSSKHNYLMSRLNKQLSFGALSKF